MKNLSLFLSVLVVMILLFFHPVLKGNLPIPADTIIGLYHPYRDLYADQYPRGIPYKNFLITDPVRQLYPWKYEAISQLKQGSMPLWNPYSFSGTPLAANIQSSPYYPLNIVFFVLPFSYAWTVFIILQPLLAGVFLFLYLREMRLSSVAALLGGIAFAFSGFSTAWLEWGTILHTALWLPLILLSFEKLVKTVSIRWLFILFFASCSQILAGHTQTLVYSLLLSNLYLVVRLVQTLDNQKTKKIIVRTFFKKYILFFLLGFFVLTATLYQWFPSLQFIQESAREVDLTNRLKEGWFIPWQHLLQFISPDFFGNFATQNYWGVWNYAEFVGYVGVVPLVFVLFAMLFRRDKKTFFFAGIGIIALLFALPTPLSKIPFLLNIPFLSTAQPTRLLFLVTFSFSVLAALGIDYFLKKQTRKIFIPLLIVAFTFLLAWVFVLNPSLLFPDAKLNDIAVAKRNLLYSSTLFALGSVAFLVTSMMKKKEFLFIGICFLILLSYGDLFRFSAKFNAFSPKAYLYPQTKVTAFLQNNIGNHRVMALDNKILPPNFSTIYGIQTIEGYDPLYLRRYGELIAAVNRNKSDISPPFGFNRIITSKNYESSIIDLLGVKYILSLEEIKSPKLEKVFEEGETKVYENNQVLPRVFFVDTVIWLGENTKQRAIEILFNTTDFRSAAVVEGKATTTLMKRQSSFSNGKASIVEYTASRVRIKTENDGDGFLLLTDSYYPTWHTSLYSENGTFQSEVKIYRTNYNFRGVYIPKGKHIVEFYNTVL